MSKQQSQTCIFLMQLKIHIQKNSKVFQIYVQIEIFTFEEDEYVPDQGAQAQERWRVVWAPLKNHFTHRYSKTLTKDPGD